MRPIVAAQLIVSWSQDASAPKPAAVASRGVARPRLRPDDPLPAQPRRRPPTQPRPAHRHPPPAPPRPATRDYIERRLAEGKTRRDAVRSLKRYLARHLYRVLNEEPL